ncbi:Crp/Fnr family transcriptional regulator [Novosphingobium soli]|uniref:Crp/Fnr family transcriptional regulator n=1 Tax=Novosphingobium soli TaxID=574956 RepID=A0ABV6CTD8_9SPHN
MTWVSRKASPADGAPASGDRPRTGGAPVLPPTPGMERFVERLRLRSVLPLDACAALLSLRGRTLEVGRGHQLATPGHEIDRATLVVDGLLGRFDQMADGSRQITALHIRGDMADLHSVPMPLPAWGIEALAPSTVLLVSHADLRSVSAAHPAIALAFWRDTVADSSILSKWAANLGRTDAATRLAHLLCEMGTRAQVAGIGRREAFALPMTQAQLADALGLTTVHVNRTMATLKQSCGLSIAAGHVRVTDWLALAEIASFDDTYLLLEPAEPQLVA